MYTKSETRGCSRLLALASRSEAVQGPTEGFTLASELSVSVQSSGGGAHAELVTGHAECSAEDLTVFKAERRVTRGGR